MKIEVRKERADDIDSIYEIISAVFETSEEADLVNALRTGSNLRISLVALKDQKIIGQVAFSPISVGEYQTTFLGLAPMAVVQSEQKKGVGSLLVRRGLEESRKMGAAAVFVLGHPGYYPKFGFLPSRSTFGIKSTYDVSDEAFMALELKKGSLDRIEGIAKYCKEFQNL